MNKKELVDAIADKMGDKKTATEAVNAVIETIQSAVATGDKVSLTGFGAFEMVHKPARTARNPSTGAEINVAESWGPKFRPGSDFKELVNTGGKKAAKKE
jgi:DNA-binding protein HU-beta